MADCCLQGLVYAADDCRPIWAIAEPGATSTTYLELDFTPYSGAVFGDASLCGGGSGSSVSFVDDGNDSTGTLTIDGVDHTILRTVRVDDDKWDRSRDYAPATDIMLLDKNVSNGGDPNAAPPTVGDWNYPVDADINGAFPEITHVYKRGLDGLIVGPPEHDVTTVGGFVAQDPTASISVDVDGTGPTEVIRYDLGTITNPNLYRKSSLLVYYQMTSAMFCVPAGSSALINAYINGAETILTGTDARLTAVNMRNRSFDPCPMSEGHVGGGSFVLNAGFLDPGQTIDLGDFVIDVTFSGFQEQTADPIVFSNGVFTQLAWRAVWITEKQ